jgi:hypothetical protein
MTQPTQAQELSYIDYEYQPETDIHMMRFREDTRKAVDEYFERMDAIYQDVNEDDRMRLLVDYRDSGIPPMRYIMREGMTWTNSLTMHPPARLAIVHSGTLAVTLLGSLIQALNFGHLSTKFFSGETGTDDALKWLVESF